MEVDIEETARNVPSLIDNDTLFDYLNNIEILPQIFLKCQFNAQQGIYIMKKCKDYFNELDCFKIFKSLNVQFNNNIVDIIKFINTSNKAICANPLIQVHEFLNSVNDYIYNTSDELTNLQTKVQEYQKEHKENEIYFAKLEEIAKILKNPSPRDRFVMTSRFFDENMKEPFRLGSLSYKVIKYACSVGLDELCTFDEYHSPFLILYSAGGILNKVKYLIECRCAKDVVDANDTDAFLVAAYGNSVSVLQYLLSNGFDKNYRNKDGMNALMMAAMNNSIQCMDYLLSIGCRMTDALIFVPILKGKLEALQYLISKGAATEVRDANGKSPIIVATIRGYLDIVAYLVSIFCNVNDQDKNKNTPLHYATINGNVEIVRYLVSVNANVNVKNIDGATPLQYATELSSPEHDQIYDILITAGAVDDDDDDDF